MPTFQGFIVSDYDGADSTPFGNWLVECVDKFGEDLVCSLFDEFQAYFETVEDCSVEGHEVMCSAYDCATRDLAAHEFYYNAFFNGFTEADSYSQLAEVGKFTMPTDLPPTS